MRCFFLRFNEAIYALEIDKWFCCTVILLPLQLLIQRKHVLSCVNSPSHHHPFTPSVPKKATQRGAALKHAHNSMNGSRFFIPIQMFPNQKIWKCVNTCMAKWITTTFLLHPLMGEFWILKAPFSLKSKEERVTGKQEGNFSLQNTFPGDYVSQMRVGTFKGLHLRDYSKNY